MCKKFIKILSSVCAVFLLFLMYVYFIGYSVQSDQYLAMRSPYDLNTEYNEVMFSRAIRKVYNKWGISDNSFLLSSILKGHQDALNKAQNVIPEGDSERAIWKIDYNVIDYSDYPISKSHELSAYFSEISQKEAKNPFVENIIKHAHANSIIWYYINRKKALQETYMNESKRKEWLGYVVKFINDERYPEFIQKEQDYIKIIPLKLVYAGFVMFIDNDFFAKYECPVKADVAKALLSGTEKNLEIYKDYLDFESISSQYEIVSKKYNSFSKGFKGLIESCGKD